MLLVLNYNYIVYCISDNDSLMTIYAVCPQ